MPPKKQITVHQILDKAFEIVQKDGFSTLTARSLAKELNCSTQPIYQEFQDMNGLRTALIQKAQEKMLEYMNQKENEDLPRFLGFMLGYVRFAKEEKNLFQLMFTSNAKENKIQEFVAGKNEQELNMIIYVHGIVMMNAFGTLNLPWDTVREMILHAYERFQS